MKYICLVIIFHMSLAFGESKSDFCKKSKLEKFLMEANDIGEVNNAPIFEIIHRLWGTFHGVTVLQSYKVGSDIHVVAKNSEYTPDPGEINTYIAPFRILKYEQAPKVNVYLYIQDGSDVDLFIRFHERLFFCN